MSGDGYNVFFDGSVDDIREHLERRLGSSEFRLRPDGVIELELPLVGADKRPRPSGETVVIEARPPSEWVLEKPERGPWWHVVPVGSSRTLCTIDTSTWQGERRQDDTQPITCPWCRARMIAIEIVAPPGPRLRTHVPQGQGGAVVVFRDNDAGFFGWLDKVPDGYYINASRNPKPSYLILHSASCPHCDRSSSVSWTKEYIKICSASRSDLEEWATETVGGQVKPCKTCLRSFVQRSAGDRTGDDRGMVQIVRESLTAGLSPDQIAARNNPRRAFWVAAIEEEARREGEYDAFEPTPEVVADLRDRRALRWERIAVRVYGDARKTEAAKQLYDTMHGTGAARQSYTGRGRRFGT